MHFTEKTPRLDHEDPIIYAARVMCDEISKGKLTAKSIRNVMTWASKKSDREMKDLSLRVLEKRINEIKAPLLARIAELELLYSASVPRSVAEEERQRAAEAMRNRIAVKEMEFGCVPNDWSEAIFDTPLPSPKFTRTKPADWDKKELAKHN